MQQVERRRRLQQIVEGERAHTEGVHSPRRQRSTDELIEETRQRRNLVEEMREEFLNLCTSREENPNGRESTRTARSAEGARAWSELFVWDTLPRETTSEDPSSPRFAAVETAGEQFAGVGDQSAGVGV